MASSSAAYYSGNYWKDIKDAIKRVPLPAKTRCRRCNKIKGVANFSEIQQDKLRRAIHTNGKLSQETSKTIICRACLETNRNELQCCVCDKVKALEGFTKAQRKNRDSARCIECVNKQGTLDTGFGLGNSDDDTDDDDVGDDNDDGNDGNESDGASNPYEQRDTYSEDEFADFTPNAVAGNMGNLDLQENRRRRSKLRGSDNDELYAEASDYDSHDGSGESDVASRASTRPAAASKTWETAKSGKTPSPAPRSMASNQNSHLGSISRYGATSTIASSVPGSRPRRTTNIDDGRKFAKVKAARKRKSQDFLIATDEKKEITASAAKAEGSDSDTDSDFGTV